MPEGLVSIKTNNKNTFPSKTANIEMMIVPSFKKYFYATYRKQCKKSISPIINKSNEISKAKTITLDETMIENKSNINQAT